MFSSRVLLNLVLITAFIALAAIAALTARKEAPANEFSPLTVSQINKIVISNNSTVTTLSKSNDTWKIQAPVTIEADDFRTHAILNILKSTSVSPYTVDKKDLKKYSLDPALAILTLNDQDILFGTTSAVNDKRYVYTNEKLFLIDDQFYPLITSGYKNLMRRQLFPAASSITKISFNKTQIFKNKKGSWVSENAAASSDDLKRFIDNWQHIQAYAVTRSTPPFTGTEVTVMTEDKSYKLLLSKSDDNTTVINPELGLSYQFDISAFDALIKPENFIPAAYIK